MDFNDVRIPWNGWKAVRQIGKGTYGTVYEIDRTIGTYTEKAAMKVIPIPPSKQVIEDAYSEGYDDESVLNICKSMHDETLKEYKLMSSLKGHPNIVSCEEIATLSTNDSIGWEVDIRMELLTPLLQSINSSQMKEEEIIKLGKDICQALVQCEEKDIVHRDIKPGNLFVDARGNYKLGDFGVARTLDHATNATRAGTERFMAPEVIARKPYDKSVDIYSLGLVMYWLLNGRRMPFLKPGKVPSHQEQEKAYSRRLSGETLWLPQYGSLPLRKIVLKACSFNRLDRYQTAREMLEDLDRLNDQQGKPFKRNNNSEACYEDVTSGEETFGSSWINDDKTVSPNFTNENIKYKGSSQLHDDPTVAPDWVDRKSRNATHKIGVNKDGYYHIIFDKYNTDKYHNINDFHRADISDSTSGLEPDSIPKPKKRSGLSKRTKIILISMGILIVIATAVFALYSVFVENDNSSGIIANEESVITVPNGASVVNRDNRWGLYLDDKLVTTFTGIAGNSEGYWYINEGLVDFSFSGKIVFNGVTYTIENGKVV